MQIQAELFLVAGGPVVLLLKLLDPSRAVNVFHRSRVERMAARANVDIEFLNGAARGECISARALHLSLVVLGMNFLLHDDT